jgi:hypothetical protein
MAEIVPALGEGAELAAVGADVGVVDVAVDDVADRVADALGAQLIGGPADGREVRPRAASNSATIPVIEPIPWATRATPARRTGGRPLASSVAICGDPLKRGV